MNIAAKTEYACVAILELARHFGSEQPLQVRQIAEAHGIPARFLVQILLQLKSAGLVASVRGASGGYRLLRDPAELTLGDVRRTIEGEREQDPPPGSWATELVRTAWRQAAQVADDALESLSFADLLTQADAQEQMYYI